MAKQLIPFNLTMGLIKHVFTVNLSAKLYKSLTG